MVDNNKITVINENGINEEVEIVSSFEFKDTQKKYVIYTKNEQDDNGNITVYISNIDDTEKTAKLLGITEDEEWNRIKDVLRELSKSE